MHVQFTLKIFGLYAIDARVISNGQTRVDYKLNYLIK